MNTNESLYIIKQLDKTKKVPVKYRGIDPTGKKYYGELKDHRNEVIPFTADKIGDIIHLINVMNKTGKEKIHEENANKYFYILSVDANGKILEELTYNAWLKSLKEVKKNG